MNVDKGHPRFPLVPGIVGGLGPFAHIGFEKRLLELATERFGAVSDADFPEWIVSSVPLPEVPVWSDASMNGETYPAPYLLKSLRRLHQAGADFAVIPCNTVHAFLPAIAGQIPLPVVHVVTETVDFVLSRFPSGRRFRRAGLLATTSTCRSGLFSRAFSAHGIELICPCDGEDPSDPSNLQERLVTTAISGCVEDGLRSGGIRAGLPDEGDPSPRDLLREAAKVLVEQHQVEAIIVACSEISLALSPEDAAVPLLDTMDILAGATLEVASGQRPLQDLPGPDTWPGPARRKSTMDQRTRPQGSDGQGVVD